MEAFKEAADQAGLTLKSARIGCGYFQQNIDKRYDSVRMESSLDKTKIHVFSDKEDVRALMEEDARRQSDHRGCRIEHDVSRHQVFCVWDMFAFTVEFDESKSCRDWVRIFTREYADTCCVCLEPVARVVHTSCWTCGAVCCSECVLRKGSEECPVCKTEDRLIV
jgi:hypothetical protein